MKVHNVTFIENVVVGQIVLGGPDSVPCKVLRIEDGVETVAPLAGRPCIKLWCRREDTGEEGYLVFGPTGFAKIP